MSQPAFRTNRRWRLGRWLLGSRTFTPYRDTVGATIAVLGAADTRRRSLRDMRVYFTLFAAYWCAFAAIVSVLRGSFSATFVSGGIGGIGGYFLWCLLGWSLDRYMTRREHTVEGVIGLLGENNLHAALIVAAQDRHASVLDGHVGEPHRVVRAALCAWWELRLCELSAAQRDTAQSLLAEFDGTAVALLDVARRL